MKAVLGQYYYAPHRNCWGVWQYDFVGDNCSSEKSWQKDCRIKKFVVSLYQRKNNN